MKADLLKQVEELSAVKNDLTLEVSLVDFLNARDTCFTWAQSPAGPVSCRTCNYSHQVP